MVVRADEPVKSRLAHLRTAAETELRGNILPFWLAHARDPSNGGFVGFVDQKMQVYPGTPRGALLTSRILWTFSAAYRAYKDPQYLAMARYAYDDLTRHFVDRRNGGLYWTITASGKPLDQRKQIYGQAFGLYALAEYYRASGEQAALDQAIALYRLIESRASDPAHGGYFDALDASWQKTDGKGSNLLGEAPKSQNSHIHIMEAYTNLLRVWPDEGLRRQLSALASLMLDKIIDPKTHHLVLFMKEDWTPIGTSVSYGHDIELSWLLVETAGVLQDPALRERARSEAVAMARVTRKEGVDLDGGVMNEGDHGKVTDPRKDWWPQAEAAVGFLGAYQISGEAGDLAAAEASWAFIEARMVDRVNGDWFESVNRDGTPRQMTKISLWKCPYHNSRACLELVERIDALSAQ